MITISRGVVTVIPQGHVSSIDCNSVVRGYVDSAATADQKKQYAYCVTRAAREHQSANTPSAFANADWLGIGAVAVTLAIFIYLCISYMDKKYPG